MRLPGAEDCRGLLAVRGNRFSGLAAGANERGGEWIGEWDGEWNGNETANGERDGEWGGKPGGGEALGRWKLDMERFATCPPA